MSEIGLYEAMSTTRAVRRHRPDPIPDEVLLRVLEAATWAPTGGNLQPWRVVVVKDPERRRVLGGLYRTEWERFAVKYRLGLEGLSGEALAKQQRTLQASDVLAENFHRSPVILVFCFNPQRMAITDADLGRPSVVGGASVYPSVQNCLLACRAEGLGCTITTLLCYREAEVRALLELPNGWYTCAAVPIGYPASKGHGPLGRRPVEQMAYLDAWKKPLGRGDGGTRE